MNTHELDLRIGIVESCLQLSALGLNQGTSGNVSARCDDRMLISPSAVPYDQLKPNMIAAMPLNGAYGSWEGPLKPSIEWRFHLDILRSRPEVNATVHAHPPYCTTLAAARRDIPACHYMVAVFGGNSVRCSGYATPGGEELSIAVLEALKGRSACLMANHGSLATGDSLEKAMWAAAELETLARTYWQTLSIGGPVVLEDYWIDEMHSLLTSYGTQEKRQPNTPAPGNGARAGH